MLQLTPQQRFFLGVEPIDFRKGIDGIVNICELKLETDPMTGAWFAFTNKGRTAVKLLVYDGQGYWLCIKRFSHGKLAWWPKGSHSAVSFRHSRLKPNNSNFLQRARVSNPFSVPFQYALSQS